MKPSFTTKPIKSHKSAPVKRQRRKPEWDRSLFLTLYSILSFHPSKKRRREAFLSKNKTEDENNPPYSPHPQGLYWKSLFVLLNIINSLASTGSHEWPSSAPSETENVASPATKFELIRYKPTISPKVSDSLQSSLQNSILSDANAGPKTTKLESKHQPLIPKCNEVDLEREISCFERKSKLASGSSNLVVSKSRPRMSTSTGSVKSKSSKPKMNKPYNTSQSYEIPIEEMRRLVRATNHLQNALCGLDESFGVTEEWINEVI
ncbi:hypothetical protein BKA69DRAFT_1042277 [Paraphysoderma sedebokerense]|nr:hypothetical protein BKA69DRAFT_1042277 [Paraphysoderma sedebokerense]